MNFREDLKRTIIIERNYECEGRVYDVFRGREPHKECIGGFHMNEVLIPRNHFRHIKGKARNYFWDRRNCAILCGVFHAEQGHTTAFKDWWKEYANKYGDVEQFINEAPLKVKQ